MLRRNATGYRNALIMVLALALVAAACGDDDDAATTTAGASVATTEAPAATTATTQASATTAGGATETTAAAAIETRWGMTEEEELAWQAIEDAARDEGEFIYYSVGSVPADRVDLLLDAFAEDYPEIEVRYLSAGNNSAIVSRITTEEESGTILGDVADMSFGNALRLDSSFFEEFVAPAAGDPEADWAFEPTAVNADGKAVATGMMAQYFGFWYNTDLVAAEDAPQNYMDLLDAMWSGITIVRQLWRTGGGNHVYTIATETYGEEWIEGMQAHDLVFAANQDQALTSLAQGEFGLAVALTGRQAQSHLDAGLPIAVVWPEDIATRVTNSIVILNGAPNPNAAKVFANWVVTLRGQELWQELGQYPVNLNVPPKEEWQQGFARSEIFFENFTQGEELEANVAKARAEFER